MRSQRPVSVTHVSVVPMDREVVLQDQTVVIRDGRIEAVSAAPEVDTSQMRVVDGRGKWLTGDVTRVSQRMALGVRERVVEN